MAELIEPTRIDDVIVNEYDNSYCRESVTVDTGQSIKAGAPIIITAGNAVVVTSTNEASTNGIAAAAGEAGDKIAAIVRGPVVCNQDQLVTEAGVTESTIHAALEGLNPPIVCLPEASIQQVSVPKT